MAHVPRVSVDFTTSRPGAPFLGFAPVDSASPKGRTPPLRKRRVAERRYCILVIELQGLEVEACELRHQSKREVVVAIRLALAARRSFPARFRPVQSARILPSMRSMRSM